MKKKNLIFIGVEVFILVGILICYSIILSPHLRAKIDNMFRDNNKMKYRIASDDEHISGNVQSIKADITVEGSKVNVVQDILLKNPQSEIYCYIPAANSAKPVIKKVQTKSGFKSFHSDTANLIITCDEPQNSIQLDYEFALSNNAKPLSYTEDFILLTNFLITPALYKNGVPILSYKWDFGDPYIYDISNYEVTVTTDKDLHIYAPGKRSEKIQEEYKTAVFRADGIRDFPVVIAKSAQVTSVAIANTTIHYIDSIEAREAVENAFRFASEKIGAYPYPEFFVVKAPISQNGMEFSNMIFISDYCFKNRATLKRVTYHEVFHQWFYGVIGTDQFNEPFFDEGLVNYLALRLNGIQINDSYNNSLFHLKLNDYQSLQQYYDLVYSDSASYFYSLHKKLGDDFYTMLQRIYADKKFTVFYFEDFLKYVNEYLGGR